MRTMLLAVLLPGALAAQNTLFKVSPATFDKIEANGNNAFPFSGANKFSFQQIHDDLAGRPRLVLGLAVRLGGGVTCAARSMNLTLSLSTAAVTSRTATGTFASNHGPDLTTVLAQVAVQWPGSTSTPTPAPFDHSLPFAQTPFLYKGQGSLCWEVRVHSNTQTAYVYHDAFNSKASHVLQGPFGQGCLATGAASSAQLSASLSLSGSAYQYSCNAISLSASQPAFWFIGIDASQWGVLPLPLDLTPLGATGCSLHTSVLLSFTGATDPSGAFSPSAPIPADPLLAGLPIYSQCGAIDLGRPLPLVLTNGYANAFPVTGTFPFPVCRIYGSGSDTALSGTYSLDSPLVTRFSYR